MRMTGKLIKGTVILDEKAYEIDDDTGTYQDRLEKCLVEICSLLNIEVPMWLNKNTRNLLDSDGLPYSDQFLIR